MDGFFAFAHFIGMIIGIALINIGSHKAMVAKKRVAIFYSAGL
jgi:hypothetical protein